MTDYYSASPIEIEDTDPPHYGRDWQADRIPGRFANVSIAGASLASEAGVRAAVAKLTAWLNAPRLAARLKPEVVASDAGVELLRTAHNEWAAVEYPADHATAHADATLTWHAGPDAERSARTDYANARGKALCVTGCEVSEDEIADAGGVPMCLACCAKAEEAFKAQRFACNHSECVRNCASHEPCGWTGTGADLIAAGNLDSDGGAFHECPKCNANSVEEVTP